jgi:2-oxoglutarate ferredoxin oxidoreductase subunit gamma
MSRVEITIAGLGGQGSITAGLMLGEAAVAYDDKYAAQTQAYSSEQRGGFAATWVIVSDEPILFPRVTHPDILVAQAMDSITRYAKVLKRSGMLIIDSDMVTDPPGDIARIFRVPATSISRNQLDAPVTANVIMLGALCAASGVVSREALEKVISKSVPKGKDQVNLLAFDIGFKTVLEQIK